MSHVHVSSHPLVAQKVTRLRDRDTPPKEFRDLVSEITSLLLYEATADLPVRDVRVQTPLEETRGAELEYRIGFVPILRAGLGMVPAALALLPETQVWHLGLYRDEASHLPVQYYNKLPEDPGLDLAIVLDPMLATGGSAVAAMEVLKQRRLNGIRFVGLIASPEGVATLSGAHPDVPIYVAALDSHLNDDAFIVPGLGDAGNRQFGTR